QSSTDATGASSMRLMKCFVVAAAVVSVAIVRAAPQAARIEWTDLGRILERADFGRPAGSVIGDPTGVLLPDGHIALFVFVDGQGVWRARSRDATGTSFTVEG